MKEEIIVNVMFAILSVIIAIASVFTIFSLLTF